MSNRMLVGVKPKTNVLLDGIPHIAGEAVGDGRTYVDLKTGDERFLTGSQQRDMVAEFRLVLDDLPGDLVDHIARARQASFKVFSFVDRTVALRRLRYVRAVHALPERVRHRKEYIEKAIPIVFEELRKDGLVTTLVPDPPENDGEELEQPTLATAIRDKLMQRIERDMETDEAQPPPDQKAPTPRTVRRLYRLYFASGQDIRVLLPLHCLKGHRGPRYLEWVNVAIDKVIDEAVLCPTPTTYADALKIACDKVTEAAAGRALPAISVQRGGDRILGKNLISRLVGRIGQFKVTNRQLGIQEARRRFSAVELGPQGKYANEHWEVDHTQLDVFVIDPLSEKAYARPWLTAIIDRYSRCIVGFSLSFAPPSWVSVMDALRIAIFPKDKLIEGLNGGANGIINKWKCEGIPAFLITDHGREFKSRSMDETLEMLTVKSFQAKKRQPWLKGKIERWFGTIEEFLHSLPGTTFSKFYKREFYKSETFAVLTIDQLNWIVAKWVIDVYHQDDHSKLPYPPFEMWSRSVSTLRPVRPAEGLDIEPLMGVVVNRCLRRGGVKYIGLRWESKAFANLRGRLPRDADVSVRIDPRDLTKAYVWDEANEKWLTGHLKEPVEAAGYSLDQWFFIEFNRKENQKLYRMSRQAAVAKAIADIKEFVDGIREGYQNSKAYQKYLEFTSKGLSAWEAVRKPAYDPEEDGPIKPHRPGATDVRATRPETGPYRDDNHPPPLPQESPDDQEETDGTKDSVGLDAKVDADASEDAAEEVEAPPDPDPTPPPPRSRQAKRATRKPKSKPAAPASPSGTAGEQPSVDEDGFFDDDFSGKAAVRSRPIDDE